MGERGWCWMMSVTDGALCRVYSGNSVGREGMVLDDVRDRWDTLEVILGGQGWERGDGTG